MSLDTIYVVNRIRLLSPQEREAKLLELLGRFPDDWLPLADTILHDEMTRRSQRSAPVASRGFGTRWWEK